MSNWKKLALLWRLFWRFRYADMIAIWYLIRGRGFLLTLSGAEVGDEACETMKIYLIDSARPWDANCHVVYSFWPKKEYVNAPLITYDPHFYEVWVIYQQTILK